MGKGKRPRPARLGEKLAKVRNEFGLSQNGMLHRLGLDDELTREELSAYERGVREPSLLFLLQVARVANLYVEALINDSVDLPSRLPSAKKSEGVARPSSLKSRRSTK